MELLAAGNVALHGLQHETRELAGLGEEHRDKEVAHLLLAVLLRRQQRNRLRVPARPCQ